MRVNKCAVEIHKGKLLLLIRYNRMADFTRCQKKAFDRIVSGTNVAALGQAGSGKAFLVRDSAKVLGEMGKKVAFTKESTATQRRFISTLTAKRKLRAPTSGISDNSLRP